MVLGGVWWITHRREEVAEAEGEQKPVVFYPRSDDGRTK
jgi:hypothetical protein